MLLVLFAAYLLVDGVYVKKLRSIQAFYDLVIVRSSSLPCGGPGAIEKSNFEALA